MPIKIRVIQNDSPDSTVCFHDDSTGGHKPGDVARGLSLRSEVAFADVPAEVARLRAAGHEVTIARGTARRMAAAGVEVM